MAATLIFPRGMPKQQLLQQYPHDALCPKELFTIFGGVFLAREQLLYEYTIIPFSVCWLASVSVAQRTAYYTFYIVASTIIQQYVQQ